MKNPALFVPGALQALQALGQISHRDVVPLATIKLVEIRASQINGCSVCVDMHCRELKKAGESDERIWAVAAWRDTPYYTEPERAALELAEVLTRLADKPDPVSDELWAELSRHYDENALGVLLLSISSINVWNRLNAAVRQVAGTPWK
jgi:AhpD family alkylhydroperoxidase